MMERRSTVLQEYLDDEEFEDSDEEKNYMSSLEMAQQKQEYKVILLGQSQCGKSALVARFMDKDVYLKEYRETIVDTFNQMMYMLDNNGTRNRKINLSIRDVGHRFVRDNMLADQDAFIVCYDVTNQETFFDVSQICKTIIEM